MTRGAIVALVSFQLKTCTSAVVEGGFDEVVCFVSAAGTKGDVVWKRFGFPEASRPSAPPTIARAAALTWQLAQSIVFGVWNFGFSMRSAASNAA